MKVDLAEFDVKLQKNVLDILNIPIPVEVLQIFLKFIKEGRKLHFYIHFIEFT